MIFLFKLFFIIYVLRETHGTQPKLDGRIVGGNLADIYQFPYQVSLQQNGRHICGASIIHQSYILTAAHCVHGESFIRFTVRAGSTSTTKGGVRVQVCAITAHSRYDTNTQDNDIAVIKLCQPLTLGKTVLPIALPEETEMFTHGTMAKVSGWGYTSEGGEQLSSTLRQVMVPLVGSNICQRMYQTDGLVTPNMICAGRVGTGGVDACQGDSGGPLVANGKLVGVVSWGYGCARPNYPGVYARVSNYRKWIGTFVGY